MPRKAGTVIRVGTPGYRAARVLLSKVKAEGWAAIGVNAAQAPAKITMGAVTAIVLVRAVHDRVGRGCA